MGNQFNYKIGKFKCIHAAAADDCKVRYQEFTDTKQILLARMGHLAFFDNNDQQMILFGGQRSGDKYK